MRGRADIEYHVTPDVLVYYTYSQGFRPGGFNRGSSNHLPDASRRKTSTPRRKTYLSDNLTNNEVGWKTMWFDHRLEVNGAVYQENWSNAQVSFFCPQCGLGNLTYNTNGPDYQVKGVELQIAANVWHGPSVNGAAAWNSGKLMNSPSLIGNIPGTAGFGKPLTTFYVKGVATPIQNVYGAQGSPLANSPPFEASLRVRYDWEWGTYLPYVAGRHAAPVALAVGLRQRRGVRPAGLDDLRSVGRHREGQLDGLADRHEHHQYEQEPLHHEPAVHPHGDAHAAASDRAHGRLRLRPTPLTADRLRGGSCGRILPHASRQRRLRRGPERAPAGVRDLLDRRQFAGGRARRRGAARRAPGGPRSSLHAGGRAALSGQDPRGIGDARPARGAASGLPAAAPGEGVLPRRAARGGAGHSRLRAGGGAQSGAARELADTADALRDGGPAGRRGQRRRSRRQARKSPRRDRHRAQHVCRRRDRGGRGPRAPLPARARRSHRGDAPARPDRHEARRARRCGAAARERARAGPGLSRGALRLRAGAAAAAQAPPGAGADPDAARGRARRTCLPHHPGDARDRARRVRAGAARISAAARGDARSRGAAPVDGAHAEDPRPAAGGDRVVPARRADRGRGYGDAYWSLANLKTYRFTDEELAAHARRRSRAAHRARGPLPSVLRARQGARGPRRVRGVVLVLRARQRAEEERMPLPAGVHRAQHPAADRGLHAGVLRARAAAGGARATRRSSSSACRAPARR